MIAASTMRRQGPDAMPTNNDAYDHQNIFGKIVRGEAPAVKVYEDDQTLAIMDIFPQSDGHVLVIHKHAEAANIYDIHPGQLETLIVCVQKIALACRKGLSPDGVRIYQFNGSRAGQTVFHLHFHVVPVYSGVLVRPHAAGAKVEPAELEKVAAKIRAAL